MLLMVLITAQTGLSLAVVRLNKKGDANSKKLAKLLAAANDGIKSYVAAMDE